MYQNKFKINFTLKLNIANIDWKVYKCKLYLVLKNTLKYAIRAETILVNPRGVREIS